MNPIAQASSQALRLQMGITEADIESRKRIVGFGAADLQRITALKAFVVPHVEDFTAAFFDHIAPMEEARELFANRGVVDRARRLKREHVAAIVSGDYGPTYVEQRLDLALLYSKVGLDTRVFLGAFQHMLKSIGDAIMKEFARKPLDGFESFMSLEKIAFFDIALIIDVLVFERERVIRQQREAIQELSTPVLQVRDRMLLLPVIGVIDTHRARLITETLLRSIRSARAKVAVIDITGVATIDSKVANHLMQTITAARLMGARVIVTGLSAEVAQSLVALGIELTKLDSVGDLQGGLEEAEHLLGYRLVRSAADASLSV
jgi:rsbT co-antagonist protein RsbR